MMPFPGGIESLPNGTLLLSTLLAACYGIIVDRPPSLRRTLVKTGAVALLALLAALEGGPALLVAALVLSSAGDAFLAHRGERPFLAGLASFLLAHLAYVALFWSEGGGLAAIVTEPSTSVIAVAMLAVVAVILSRLWPVLGFSMRAPVALYCAAILGMGIASLSGLAAGVVAGAVLFMASDAILAIGRFLVDARDPRQSWMQPLVWALYYAAQLLLVLSFIAP